MKYIEYVNSLIKSRVADSKDLVMFGQNVSAGSCISGLTRGLNPGENGLILNTPNCENTLVGTGFGLMLNGVSSIFFMKQQDFLLLGIDQLVNTYNLVRRRKMNSSFTIFCVVVDSGYEGPQSALNNFSDFCSIARIPGYAITNKHDGEIIINKHLVSPGFRIIGISQRLNPGELIEVEGPVFCNEDGSIFRYKEGNDATIVCFNFSFPQGLSLWKHMNNKNVNASLFSVNTMLPSDWTDILFSVRQTGRIVILDDSKSVNRSCYQMAVEVQERCMPKKLLLMTREMSDDGLRPHHDQFAIAPENILTRLGFDHAASSAANL